MILHIDCNSFYASVELLKFPELKDKPVAVAGSEDNRHGIILAKNEAAKKYEIKTAETVWQAKRKCPNLILLPPHHNEYHEYSKIINSIYSRYTDLIEPFGIDESWLDITGSWHLFAQTPMKVAEQIRQTVKKETGLTVSIGVSFNKVYAKLGSDYKKPDAITEINKSNYKQMLYPMPVGMLLYVGKKTQKALAELGIKTIGELAEADPALLQNTLGKMGPELRQNAAGENDSQVSQYQESEQIKSIGNGITFRRNLVGEKDIALGLMSLADEVAERLRKYGLYGKAVQVQIKNTDLKSISRQKQLVRATNTSKDIFETGMQLVKENWSMKKPIRMLTVTAMQLQETPDIVQTSLLEDIEPENDKREKLEKSMDKIRSKYGRTAILQGGALHNNIGIPSRAKTKEKKEE